MKIKIGILISFLLLVISCKNSTVKTPTRIVGNALGTTFSILYIDSENRVFESEIDSIFHSINKSLSTYIPTSDISKINAGDTTVTIDANFKEVFYKAEKIYKETDGIFDPTIGILVNAWGFGPGDEIENLDSLKIKELLKYVGFNKVSLTEGKVKKQYPEIYFDFNAIAKGFTVDILGRFLEHKDIQNYLVEIGGEVRARGKNFEKLWTIAIENPNFDGSRSFAKTISLDNQSIATSGNYRKYKIDENGKKYVHTINPKTGLANENNMLSASVIASLDCADVDGYSTSLMAMGFENAIEFLKEHQELTVFLIYLDKDNTIKTYQSKGINN